MSQQITNDFKCPACGGNHWKITDHSNLELIVCRGCKWQGTREEGFASKVKEAVSESITEDSSVISKLCGSCKFWERVGTWDGDVVVVGKCHFFPPRHDSTPPGSSYDVLAPDIFPLVEEEDWCGQWVEKES